MVRFRVNKELMLVSVLIGMVAVMSSVALATPIVADVNGSTGYTLAEVSAAGGIIVGDKLFDGFRVTTTKSTGAIAPDDGTISITAVKVGGDYGLRFNGGWSAPAGTISDSTIKFHVSVLPDAVARGWQIKDNSLWISGYGVSSTSDGAAVSVSENVYTSDPDVGHTNPVANKFVYYKNDNDNTLYDHKEFVPVTEVWIVKDVIAYGGTGSTGVAHMSEFYQTFSQVPEPATIALLGLGSLVLVYRKKKAH